MLEEKSVAALIHFRSSIQVRAMAVQYASAPPQCEPILITSLLQSQRISSSLSLSVGLPAAYPPAYPHPTLPGQAPAAPAPVMQQSQQTVVISQPAATAVTVNNNLQ